MQPVRADLVLVHHQDAPFHRAFIINDRATNRYWNTGPVQFEMARIFSREQDWARACRDLRAQFEQPLSDEEIQAAYDGFADLGLLELTEESLANLPMRTYERALRILGMRHHDLLERVTTPADLLAPVRALLQAGDTEAPVLRAAFHRALHIERTARDNAHLPAALRWMRVQVPLFDPTRQLERWLPRVSWLFRPWFFLLTLLLGSYGFITYIDRAREVHQRLSYVSGNLALLFFCTVLMLVVHEYAHALTCKHFGGGVREIGIIVFLFFIPAAYCDVSDAHLFPGRRKKLWVTFAGTWSTFILASAGALIWSNTVPTAILNHIGLVLMASGYATVFTNLNPLLPLDGYFFLSDWLGIDNLRDRAPEYCKAYLVALFTGRQCPPETARNRRILFAYFLFGSLYQIFYLLLSVGFGWLIFVRGGTRLGLLLYVALVYLFYVRNYLVRLRSLWQASRVKQLFGYTLAGTGLLALLVFVPVRAQFTVPAIVRETGRVALVSPESAWIDVLPKNGTLVRQGEQLFRLRAASRELIIAAPVSGTIMFTRDWMRRSPVAAGETIATLVMGHVLEGTLPQRFVDDVRNGGTAQAVIGNVSVPTDGVAVWPSKTGPLMRVAVSATAESQRKLDPGTSARVLVRSGRTTTLWRRLFGEQWDRVILDVWRLL